MEQLCEKVAVEISLNEAYPSDHYMPHHGSYNAVLPTAENAAPDVLQLLNAIKEDQKENANSVRQFANRIDNLQARQDKSEMEQERAFNAKDYKSNNFEPNKLRTPITGQQPHAQTAQNGNPGAPAPWEVRHAQEGANRTYYPRRNRSNQRTGFTNGQRQRSRSQNRPRSQNVNRYGTAHIDQDAPEPNLMYNPKVVCRTCGQTGHSASGCNLGPKIQRTGEQIPVPVQPKDTQAPKNE